MKKKNKTLIYIFFLLGSVSQYPGNGHGALKDIKSEHATESTLTLVTGRIYDVWIISKTNDHNFKSFYWMCPLFKKLRILQNKAMMPLNTVEPLLINPWKVVSNCHQMVSISFTHLVSHFYLSSVPSLFVEYPLSFCRITNTIFNWDLQRCFSLWETSRHNLWSW